MAEKRKMSLHMRLHGTCELCDAAHTWILRAKKSQTKQLIKFIKASQRAPSGAAMDQVDFSPYWAPSYFQYEQPST